MIARPRLLLPLIGLALTGLVVAAEEAPHTVVLKVGAFEVRDYPALVAAEVTIGGDRNRAVNAGFRLLAHYIFGSNDRSLKIPMTAPVVQAQAGSDSWLIRFLLPRGYSLATLPAPQDPLVHLTAVPPAQLAVVRFSGLAHDPDVARSAADLQAFIESHHLKAAGPPTLARYDPPWTPWFMRRNEIWVPLVVASTH